jgi:hypothetical protein
MMKELVVQYVTKPIVQNLMHLDRRLNVGSMAVQLNLDEETVKRPEL